MTNIEEINYTENYAWVDERLNELYYGYALTDENIDEFEEMGLLNENYAWVDERLNELYYGYEYGYGYGYPEFEEYQNLRYDYGDDINDSDIE